MTGARGGENNELLKLLLKNITEAPGGGKNIITEALSKKSTW